jgi:hypothetical protein
MSMLDKYIPVRRDYDMERYHRHHVRNACGFKRLQKRLARRLSRRCARRYIAAELVPEDWRAKYAHGPGGAFLGDDGDAARIWFWRAYFVWLEDY